MGKSKVKKWTLLYTEISKLGEGGNADVYLVEVNSNPRIPFVTQDSLFVNENPVL